MENTTDPSTARTADSPGCAVEPDERLTELSSLLTSLDEAARADARSRQSTKTDHQGQLALQVSRSGDFSD